MYCHLNKGVIIIINIIIIVFVVIIVVVVVFIITFIIISIIIIDYYTITISTIIIISNINSPLYRVVGVFSSKEHRLLQVTMNGITVHFVHSGIGINRNSFKRTRS